MSNTNGTNGHLIPTTPGLLDRLWARVRAQTRERLAGAQNGAISHPSGSEGSERRSERQTRQTRIPGDHSCLIRLVDTRDRNRSRNSNGSGSGNRSGTLGFLASSWGESGEETLVVMTRELARKFSCPGEAADWWMARSKQVRSFPAEIMRLDGTPVSDLAEIVTATATATPIEG
jgi:hypothetical protein